MEEQKKKFDNKKKYFTEVQKGIILYMYTQGATDVEVAQALGMKNTTFRNRLKYNEMMPEVLIAKKQVDEYLKLSLFRKATGYSFPETKFFVVANELIEKEVIKHYPPSETAIQMMMNLKSKTYESEVQEDELVLKIVRVKSDPNNHTNGSPEIITEENLKKEAETKKKCS